MKKREAFILRDLIIRNFKSAPLLNELTAKLKAQSIDDWALSIEEVMALGPINPDQFYMKQIEKIALLLGCSPKDSMEIAVKAYADVVKEDL